MPKDVSDKEHEMCAVSDSLGNPLRKFRRWIASQLSSECFMRNILSCVQPTPTFSDARANGSVNLAGPMKNFAIIFPCKRVVFHAISCVAQQRTGNEDAIYMRSLYMQTLREQRKKCPCTACASGEGGWARECAQKFPRTKVIARRLGRMCSGGHVRVLVHGQCSDTEWTMILSQWPPE